MKTAGFATRFLGVVAFACLAVPSTPRAADGVTLTLQHGSTPQEVRLDWTGGISPYQVYGSADKTRVVQAANNLGQTSGHIWIDVPPAGTLYLYRIVGPCLTPSPEVCDGVDDDCDGHIDNGCPGFCAVDGDCPAAQFCDPSGTCVADLVDGGACTRSAQCAGDHCSQGVCCASGDCCTSPAQCPTYSQPSTCGSPSTCQGTRLDAVCGATFQCGSQSVDDDSGCAGLVSSTCGLYPSIACTAAPTQPSDQASLCPTTCVADAGCDAAAHCESNACLPDVSQGGVCSASNQCSTGICADSVCCENPCAGTCKACDLAGTLGTCTNVPSAQDPDAECGGVSCSNYYYGWSGSSCQRKADVPAAVASCDGAGACRTQAAECGASNVAGGVALTCDAACQTPTAGTCTGTTAGTCTNVITGSTTCGLGACQRSVLSCVNGVPSTCVPGTGTTETCNGIDDNCDGAIDNGPFSDSFEPNNDCASVRTLGGVGSLPSDNTLTYTSMTLYPIADIDTYLIHATETDSGCSCGFPFLDEDYNMYVRLTVPPGAGSYELCMNTGSCSFPAGNCFEAAAGQTFTITQFLDGACPGIDSYDVYVRVRGLAPPGYSCQPYTLSYTFESGYCR